MICLNTSQFLKKIATREYVTAYIYEGQHRTTDSLNTFEKIIADNPQQFQDLVSEFAKDYPFIFTLALKKGRTTSVKDWDRVCVNFAHEVEDIKLDPVTPQQNTIYPINGISKTPEQIESDIRSRLELEMQLKQAQEDNNRVQARLSELETTGGKLAHVGYNILMQFITPKAPAAPAAQLQGIDPNELERSLAKLVDVLGSDTIIRLANKIQPGDPVINIVKNYANG